MKNLRNIALVACLLLTITSCKKDEVLDLTTVPLGLGGDPSTNTTIDKWITDSLTTPYNIVAVYKWDPWNVSLYKTLVPVQESRVLPLFSALKSTWINPYNDETGSQTFIKKYSPKQFVLVGSVEYDYYTVTLGQAEGGNNIVFFDVNQNFDKDPVMSIKRVIHTAHHEFGHILHQTVAYPMDFKGTSSKLGLAGYTATWFNVADTTAQKQGYATSYAMSGPDDDFVETLSTMLTEGKANWESLKASVNITGRTALQQKEDFVVTYFRQVWKIDFYSLQSRVQAALNVLFPVPDVLTQYGFGKTFTRASVDVTAASTLSQAAGFANFMATTKAFVSSTSGGLFILDSFAVVQNAATTAQIKIYIHYGATVYTCIYNYNVTKDANNVFTYTYVGADAIGGIFIAYVTPLVNFFSNNKFVLSWFSNPTGIPHPKIQFTPQAIPASYFVSLGYAN